MQTDFFFAHQLLHIAHYSPHIAYRDTPRPAAHRRYHRLSHVGHDDYQRLERLQARVPMFNNSQFAEVDLHTTHLHRERVKIRKSQNPNTPCKDECWSSDQFVRVGRTNNIEHN